MFNVDISKLQTTFPEYLYNSATSDDTQTTSKVKRSAITSCGQGTLFMSSCGRFGISQTIGQQSVIGCCPGPSYIVLQGFQQPSSFNLIENTDDSGTLGVLCYPNPVTANLILSFNETTENSIDIRIFDTTGKLHNAYNFPFSHTITLNLSGFPVGLYIIKIQSGDKTYTTTITKN